MKINGRQQLLAYIARRSLVLGSLLVMALTCAGAADAQSSGPNAPTQVVKPAAATETQAPAPGAKPMAAQTKSLQLPEEKHSAKGAKEGISVHGHWRIEVRNPDGSVAKHIEFENSICPTQTGFNHNFDNPNTVFPGGALFLSQLATGQSTLGAWMIFLGNQSELNKTSNVPAGCKSAGPLVVGSSALTGYVLVQNIGIFADLSSIPNYCPANVCAQIGGPTTPTPASPSIALSGTIPGSYTLANGGGEIDIVSTVNFSCAGLISISTCAATPPDTASILTGTQLITGSSTPPVTYTAGQSIAVAVIISFSGN